jgi:hypothetical protein
MKNTLAQIEIHPNYKSKLSPSSQKRYVDLDHINYILLHQREDITAKFFMTDGYIISDIINFKEIIHTSWFIPVNLCYPESGPEIAYLAPRRISQIIFQRKEKECIIQFIGSDDLWIKETPEQLQQLIDALKYTCINYKTL